MFITILLPAGRRNPSSRQPWARVISEWFFLPIGLDGDLLLIDEEFLISLSHETTEPLAVLRRLPIGLRADIADI
jgi:hypothetical protein